jgi:hypothetical protein
MRVTHIGPLSLAKVAFVVYGCLGLFIGGLFAIAAVLGSTLSAAAGEESALFGTLFGVGAVVTFPLLYGCMAAVASLVLAGLYNLVAGFVGGVEVSLAPTASAAAPPLA